MGQTRDGWVTVWGSLPCLFNLHTSCLPLGSSPPSPPLFDASLCASLIGLSHRHRFGRSFDNVLRDQHSLFRSPPPRMLLDDSLTISISKAVTTTNVYCVHVDPGCGQPSVRLSQSPWCLSWRTSIHLRRFYPVSACFFGCWTSTSDDERLAQHTTCTTSSQTSSTSHSTQP